MDECQDYKNPLKHSGTNQSQRFLPGLKSDYVSIIEHDYAEWINFAAQFSRYIHFVDLKGIKSADWRAFFASDISAILGGIAVQNVESYRQQIKFLFDEIKRADSVSVDVKVQLYQLFSAVFSLAKGFDRIYDQLQRLSSSASNGSSSEQNDGLLEPTLKNLIKNKLKPALERMLLYYDEAEQTFKYSVDAIYDVDFSNWKVLSEPVQTANVLIGGLGLGEVWWKKPDASLEVTYESWEDYYQDVTALPNANLLNNVDLATVLAAVNHNLFTSVFDVFIQVYQKVVSTAENDLLNTLASWPQHAPHYALFLTFLKLYRNNVDQLNQLTVRHLDYYYKDILQFQPKPAQPNQAHVILELSKTTTSGALKKGKLFKAGKDSGGQEIVYALDNETTFTQAKVAALKSVYFGQAGDSYTYSDNGSDITVNNEQRLFASPITNSADGIGGKLTTQTREWPVFTSYVYENDRLTDVLAPNATIGFAVASSYLFLAEGSRTIRLRLKTSNNSAFAGLHYSAFLTTEDGWLELESDHIRVVESQMSNAASCVEFELTLDGNTPEIQAYNTDIHEHTYNVNVPVLRIELTNTDQIQYPYTTLRDITLEALELKVEVGMGQSTYNQQGIKNLFITADTGQVDASKPFQPFGAQPQIGASLIIGAKEVFTKPGARLRLHLEWKGIVQDRIGMDYDKNTDTTSSGITPSVQLEFLEGGEWISEKPDGSSLSPFQLFQNSGDEVLSTYTKEIQANWIREGVFTRYDQEYKPYGSSSAAGFLRFSLLHDFGHKAYMNDYTLYLIDKANKVSPEPSAPVEPYTPTLKSVYMSYEAATGVIDLTDSQTLNNNKGRFFHIYPFGEAEQHQDLLNQESDVYVFPQFNHTDDKPESTDITLVQSKKHNHIGEFYIGLEKLSAQESVNILFQVMEGTTDPLVSKPEFHVAWSYLSANEWVNFKDQELVDRTLQLIKSGIISFSIPSGATTEHTLLPKDHIWLRASISEAAGAVAKLISVQAQAALVTFSDQGNATDVLAKPLAASTISKLKVPLSWVKKIAQPYSSFGGRAVEQPEKFYTRVSERLRHRDRASTIWDYEHLILEAFPTIYKVKCLNHTRVEDIEVESKKFYSENQPGYVTIITVPSLVNRNDTDKLKPYTHQSTLAEIKTFLASRVSAHVNVIVENPLYEEVKTGFKLKLKSGYQNFTYYANLLREEITQFLSPWLTDNAAEIEFGGKLYKSTVIDFIEERPYVEFITDMNLRQKVGENSAFSEDMEMLSASSARSVLVSVESYKHEISEYDSESVQEDKACFDEES